MDGCHTSIAPSIRTNRGENISQMDIAFGEKKTPSTSLGLQVTIVMVGSMLPWRLGVPPAATASVLPNISSRTEADLTCCQKEPDEVVANGNPRRSEMRFGS